MRNHTGGSCQRNHRYQCRPPGTGAQVRPVHPAGTRRACWRSVRRTFPSVLPDVGSGTARQLQLVASVSAAGIGVFGLYTVVRTQDRSAADRGSQPRDPYRDDETGDRPTELLDELLEPEATQAESGDWSATTSTSCSRRSTDASTRQRPRSELCVGNQEQAP